MLVAFAKQYGAANVERE